MEEFKDTKSILMMSEEMLEEKLEIIYQRAMKKHKQLSEIIDGNEAQDLLKVGRTTLFKLRSSGEIPYYKINGTIVYKRSELMQFIEANKYETF